MLNFQTTQFIICRQSKYRRELSRYLKRFVIESRFFSISGEDLHHRCFSSVYYVRTVMQPDIDAVFGLETFFFLQIIETVFAEYRTFWPLTGWGLHRFV